MAWKDRYLAGKQKLLSDTSVCSENRTLFEQFFSFEEHKLKRSNTLRELDEACYNTLYGYILKFRNVNAWFDNTPWKDLTRSDIQRVYDDLEDGRILNQKGKPFEDRAGYYNRVMKSKPFRMVGKSELAKDVIEFPAPQRREVRFLTEESFRRLVDGASKPEHRLLFWLAWDVGENVGALLQLTHQDFRRQVSPHTGEAEYLVRLPREKIKRSRRERTEPTLYEETVRYLDLVLAKTPDGVSVFPFGYRQALKLIHRIGRRLKITTMPNGDGVRWKDLRSGMACHLLKTGWSFEEVNARLGHKPGSNVLNAYINFLALDRAKPKQKLVDASRSHLQQQLRDAQLVEKRVAQQLRRHEEDNKELWQAVADTQDGLATLKDDVRRLLLTLAIEPQIG